MFSAEKLVLLFVASQVCSCVGKMNSPAAADGAFPCFSAATARTTAATAATRCPAPTARPSPAARRTSACPGRSCVTGRPTAGTGGTSLGGCAVRPARTCTRVRPPSFGAETVGASLRPLGVTTRWTAPTAAMRSTVVSPQVSQLSTIVFLQVMCFI